GRAAEDVESLDCTMKEMGSSAALPRTRVKTRTSTKTRSRVKKGSASAPKKRTPAGAGTQIEEALRAWRLGEARKLGVPAFRIFSDKALRAMADARPTTAAGLLKISGIGKGTVEKFGRQLYRLLKAESK
ncbi:MAG: HRDC domain-containing protein, partial [Acidobacteriota bacterium]